jgi:hypothetical protein
MENDKKEMFDAAREGALGMRGTKQKIPNPGSELAVKQGCTCAVLDNCRGDPEFGKIRGFYITKGCPLHDKNIEWD